MNQHYTANYCRLQLGDRLVREKGIFSKHHGIYVGYHNGIPLVAENQSGKGVQYVSLESFLLWNDSNLIRIERFSGNDDARRNIIQRINNLIGTEYNLINFNCEHFAELIQNGRSYSRQVSNAAVSIGLLFFIGIAIASNKQ